MNELVDKCIKSIIKQDRASIVICSLSHEIIYMNESAIEAYSKRGGEKLIGQSLLLCHNEESKIKILEVIEWFLKSPENNIVHTFYSEKHNKDVYMVALRDEKNKLIGYFEKHEFREKDRTPLYNFMK